MISGIGLNLLPVYLYSTIFGMEFRENFLLIVVTTLLSTLILSIGYHNIAYLLRIKLNNKREGILTSRGGGENKKKAEECKRKKGENTKAKGETHNT